MPRDSCKRSREVILPCVPSAVATENRHKCRRLFRHKRLGLPGPSEHCVVTNLYASFTQQYADYLRESYWGRSYYGSPDFECEHCHALFWYTERVRGSTSPRAKAPAYNLCCRGGKIWIPPFKEPPSFLQEPIKFNGNTRCKKFLRHIRQYNCLFAFTSMGARIDHGINRTGGPYVFRINGQVHHRIGSLLPPAGDPPQFIELYIYDTDNEVPNRIHALDISDRLEADLDRDIIEGQLQMLDAHNPLVKTFRMARDRLKESDGENVGIRIIGACEGDHVQYNLPACDELALLVVGDFSLETYKRDIIVHCFDDKLQQISSLHLALMALQYPLLFPYGERGFQVGIPYIGASLTKPSARNKMIMQDYYRYWFHYRRRQPNPYLCYGRLSSQAVDARACINESRLQWIIDNQPKLRVEHFQGIVDAVEHGCIDGDAVGKRTYLPASHTSGRRYMLQNFHDAVAIARVYGPTDIFLTFTSNPKWPEITEALRLESGQTYTDRADLVVRVYHMKLQDLLGDTKDGTAFGPINAGVLPPVLYFIFPPASLFIFIRFLFQGFCLVSLPYVRFIFSCFASSARC
ncbi:uncharacterized protein LOC133886841 isoform X2 [Phragmites australis]|uniref:uncharacterized protein LOC133886841 isoform X2 n=1 Tax=Phragmites australis TaxID=29695 RepID=UPI002D77AD44|nr:uncharacterized protein LOC133886841 isoform X2 [Phragmites australis]